MTNHFEGKKEFDPGKEFLEAGGEILEFYPNGQPKHWRCGHDKTGGLVHPRGVEKECICSINKDGQYEGCNPDQQDMEELALWRSDWAKGETKPEKREKE